MQVKTICQIIHARQKKLLKKMTFLPEKETLLLKDTRLCCEKEVGVNKLNELTVL